MARNDRFTQITVISALTITAGLFTWVHAPNLGALRSSGAETEMAAAAEAPAPAPAKTPIRVRPQTRVEGVVPASFDADGQDSAEAVELGADLDGLAARIVEGSLSRVGSLALPRPAEVLVYRDRDGRTVVAPGTRRRYEPVVRFFAEVDTDSAVALIRGRQEATAASTQAPAEPLLLEAIDELLAVDLPLVEPDMVATTTHWEFADADYAALSEAQKHLLLMGVQNARAVQEKLRRIRSEFAPAVVHEPEPFLTLPGDEALLAGLEIEETQAHEEPEEVSIAP